MSNPKIKITPHEAAVISALAEKMAMMYGNFAINVPSLWMRYKTAQLAMLGFRQKLLEVSIKENPHTERTKKIALVEALVVIDTVWPTETLPTTISSRLRQIINTIDQWATNELGKPQLKPNLILSH